MAMIFPAQTVYVRELRLSEASSTCDAQYNCNMKSFQRSAIPQITI